MQRFFTTFPAGWPGTGLFFLRLALGFGLLGNAFMGVSHAITPVAVIFIGSLVLVGLWTPVAAIAACAFQLATLQLLEASVAFSLCLLGPGAWSVDARLFGRRRLEIRHLRNE